MLRWIQLFERISLFVCALCLVGSAGLAQQPADARDPSSEKVSFRREILPLLSERCFLCHGPDEGTREAELRLDLEEEATRDRDGMFIIKPGDPEASEILARITAEDETLLMPPPDSGRKPLTAKQIDTIRRWIAEGAQWSRHWAFVPPKRPAVPDVKNAESVRNPIDAFVLRRLEQEKLEPSEEADRVTLLRRLSLDLIGLPPSVEEIDAFLADQSPGAYEQQVERLLASPHYGERWGRIWLDAARYADSDGFEKDKPREVWFYRDWVINSLNRDLPYDQFIVEQIAGDLLPNATQDQIVATGFLRNSMLNEEGGIDPEEFRMQAMFDRMDTIGKSILGFTVQCAQCHNHKFDPFTQRDYYSMFAFLNNCHEAQPAVYTDAQQKQREDIFRRIDEIENQLRAETPDWRERMAAWEEQVRGDQPNWMVLPIKNAADNSQRYYQQEDGSLLAQGYAPTRFSAPFSATTDLPEIRAFRLELLNDPNLPAGGPGRGVNGLFALSEFTAEAFSVDDPEQKQEIQFVRATADFSNDRMRLGHPYNDTDDPNAGITGSVEYATDGDKKTAWGIDAGPGRRNQPRKAVFVTDKNVAFPGGTKLVFNLGQHHGGPNSDDNQTLNLGRFRISATAVDAVADPLPAAVRKLLDVPAAERTDAQTRQIFSFWRTTVPQWSDENAQIEALWKEHPEGTTQFVLRERNAFRETHLLDRGDFLKPKATVGPDVPDFLNPLEEPRQINRLAFARWLVKPESPTTARSIVNRIWQAYFGTGIVSTPEDLGSAGSSPSHPVWLDWVAVELMAHDWSLKHIHRLIVLSGTYRQSSDVSAELLAADPDNRLLARGPRFRVDAEVVRDIFLTASGLLERKIGGPSVFPPAPAFLFQRPVSYGPKTWNVETGPDRYRRAIYTFRFRSVPYPALQAFDAPSGEFATVQRPRSNSPLQALTTLNEPLFFECAEGLALRALVQEGDSDQDRLTYAFRCCVARAPTSDESDALLGFLEEQRQRLMAGSLDAKQILGKAPVTTPLPEDVDPAELAAWTTVCRVLLNLDETITKE